MAGSDLNPTLNKSGQPGPSPREYNAHQRHSRSARRRHDDQSTAFIAQQVTRLSSSTAVIFAKIAKYGAARVKAAANLAAIP
jgi:hypothetical protein